MQEPMQHFDQADIESSRVASAFSYFGFLFFLPLIVAPNSKFGRFHANQSLLCFIVYIALSVASKIVGWIPIIGWIVRTVLFVIMLALLINGFYQAYQGKAKEIPFLGHIKIIQ